MPAIIGYVISDGTWNNTTKSFFVETDSINFTIDEAVEMFINENWGIDRDTIVVNPILEPITTKKTPTGHTYDQE